jgi:hypothetical protein
VQLMGTSVLLLMAAGSLQCKQMCGMCMHTSNKECKQCLGELALVWECTLDSGQFMTHTKVAFSLPDAIAACLRVPGAKDSRQAALMSDVRCAM